MCKFHLPDNFSSRDNSVGAFFEQEANNPDNSKNKSMCFSVFKLKESLSLNYAS